MGVTVREAQFVDIPRLVDLMCEAHARSKYARRGRVEVTELKELFVGALQRTQTKGPGGTCGYVAEDDGQIVGLILGVTERIYHALDKLLATDIFFYVQEGVDPKAFLKLLAAFEAWAESNPRIVEVRLGVTDAITDPERVAAVYERKGYVRSGVMLERRVGL